MPCNGVPEDKTCSCFHTAGKNQEPFNQNPIPRWSRSEQVAILASCLLPLGPGITQSPPALSPHARKQEPCIHIHTSGHVQFPLMSGNFPGCHRKGKLLISLATIGKAKREGCFRTMKRSFGVFFFFFLFSLPPPPLEKEKGVKFVTSELFFSAPPPTYAAKASTMESLRSCVLCR